MSDRILVHADNGYAEESSFESFRETMDVCKCIVLKQHKDTQNIRQTECPLEKLLIVEEEWETPGFSFSKLEQNGAKSYCHLHGAQSCGGNLVFFATMSFVGFDLMLLWIEWGKKQKQKLIYEYF
ncbi:hypothetical protein TNCV_296981 [Trichonephila clavipes]|nr:hypothetical protein TNCV_296981 [Trichonephila clavipes]